MKPHSSEVIGVPVHLLLVDDDRLVLSTLSHALRRCGYQVATADSMTDALALLADGLRPNLAILDVRMNNGNGLELAQCLCARYQLPFIMLSAYSDTETVQEAANIGALGYLVKPINAAKMVPTIESALRRASELQELAKNTVHLQQALDTDRDVDVAVGIVMAQHRLGRLAALELLRQSARTQQRKLRDLAQDMIRAAEAVRQPDR
ncbi:MAG: response regulator [Rhodoferax sp.]|nr:response regulator [Rhodoferax sp.]